MLRMLERNIETIEKRLVVLAPSLATPPQAFTNVTLDPTRHRRLVSKMQALRGSVYLHEGNIKPHQLSSNGLHQTPEDEQSWHLLMMASPDDVSSCAWYREHDETTVSFDDLRVRNCALAQRDGWKERLTASVESEIAQARRERLRYAEVGGWAVANGRRGTPDGLLLALATYGLCRALGGALVVTTANVTHCSSAILRRLGGSYLESEGEPLPAYFDPRYNTNIELVRFDSRKPNPRYLGLVQTLMAKLSNVAVVADSFSVAGTNQYAEASGTAQAAA